jgi:outer membrane protein assembly factor BamB
MSRLPGLTVLAAAAALSACSTVERINPFGGNDQAGPTAPQDGRVSILSFEQQLAPDPNLRGRIIAPPAAMPFIDWSQPGGVATNAPGHVLADASLDVAFRQSLGRGSSRDEKLAAPPIIMGGVLYFLDASHELRAFNAADGDALWSQDLRPVGGRDRRALGGGIAGADGRIYAVTGFGDAIAFDAATGQELWRTRADAPFHAAPTVSDGRVYAVTNDSELVAFDAADGTVLWTHQAIAEPARILAASSPAVAGDTIVAPFASGELVALLSANGRRLWVDALSRAGRLTSLSAINDIAGRPVIDNGTLFAASHSGLLAAIDMRSGQRIWARSFASTQTPWVAGQQVYAVTVDGELACLDRNTGAAYWVTQLPRFEDEEDREDRIAWTGPILAGNRLILASSTGEVIAVNPETGEVTARQDVGAPVFIPPIAAGGLIYIVTDEARLVALR